MLFYTCFLYIIYLENYIPGVENIFLIIYIIQTQHMKQFNEFVWKILSNAPYSNLSYHMTSIKVFIWNGKWWMVYILEDKSFFEIYRKRCGRRFWLSNIASAGSDYPTLRNKFLIIQHCCWKFTSSNIAAEGSHRPSLRYIRFWLSNIAAEGFDYTTFRQKVLIIHFGRRFWLSNI